MKLGEGTTRWDVCTVDGSRPGVKTGERQKILVHTVEQAELIVNSVNKAPLLIECRDVLQRLIDNGLHGVTPTDFDTIRALLAKLES